MKNLNLFTTLVFSLLAQGILQSQVTLPYTQNFDAFPVDNVSFGPGAEPNAFPQNWVNVQGDVANQDWYGRSINTGSSGTGPTVDHTSGTGVYVFVEDGWGNNTDVTLETPQVDLVGISAAQFSYWANSYTSATSNYNVMHLDVFYNSAWVLDIDQFDDLTVGNTWVERIVDISAYTGQIVRFRFRGDNSNQSFQHDIAIDDVSIVETELTAQINNSDTTIECFGETTGYAVASAIFGATPFSYNWSNGATTDSIGGLAAGDYTVTVTDNNGDTSVAEISISQNPDLSNFSSLTQLVCFGDSDGVVVIDSTNGGTPFIPECGVDTNVQCSGSESIDTIGFGVLTNSNTGYPAPYGNWYWGAKHQIIYTKHELNQAGIVGASRITSIGFDVSQINGTANYNSWTLRMGCESDSLAVATGWNSGLETVLDPVNKTVVVGWNVDTFDYAYVWDGESNIILEVCFNNVGFTNNSFTRYTSTGFTSVRYYRADNGAVCSNTTSTTGVSANRPNTIFGSCPISPEPYTYEWSTNDTIDSIGGLGAGDYILTVTDGLLCEFVDSFSITQPDSMFLTMVLDSNVSCFGLSDGSAVAEITGGTPSYTYTWSNGGANDTIDSLIAGTYYVTINDSFNCGPLNDSITISEPDSLIATAMTDSNASCNGFMDGVASVMAMGGNGGNVYTWSNAGDSNVISGLMAGSYQVTVTDSVGCSDTSGTVVTHPDSLIADASIDAEISCFEAADGEASVSTTGGTMPYAILWSDSSVTSAIADLSPGVYLVTITDSNNCISNDSVELTQPDLLEVTGQATNAICEGGEDGSVDITVTGGTMPYDFDWSNSATTEDLTNVGSGSYAVTVTDDNGCDSMASYVVSFDNLLPVVDLGADTSICDTASITLDAGTHSSYVWSDASIMSTLLVNASGSYSVTVADAAGCEGSDTISIETSDCVGITEAGTKSFIHIYPNPSNGRITVDFGSNDINVDGYEIVDVTGAIIEVSRSSLNSGAQLDLSSLSAGSYFLKFNTEVGPQIGVITIQ